MRLLRDPEQIQSWALNLLLPNAHIFERKQQSLEQPPKRCVESPVWRFSRYRCEVTSSRFPLPCGVGWDGLFRCDLEANLLLKGILLLLIRWSILSLPPKTNATGAGSLKLVKFKGLGFAVTHVKNKNKQKKHPCDFPLITSHKSHNHGMAGAGSDL